MVDKSWTLERAWNAHEAALEFDPSLNANDPTLPVHQWIALRELDRLEENYKKDRFCLMRAIALCAHHGLSMPKWVSQDYLKGYRELVNANSMSLDDVFARPYKKGKHAHARQKELRLKRCVPAEVARLKIMNPDRPLVDNKKPGNNSIFAEVANKFFICTTDVKRLYYGCEFTQWMVKERTKQRIRT